MTVSSSADNRLVFNLNGEEVIANADGSALFDDGGLLAFSDLHLEKGRALSRTTPIPGYDTMATLDALEAAIRRDNPRKLLFLGDSFHRSHLAESLDDDHRRRINTLAEGRDVIWLVGNHDPALPSWLPGQAADDYLSRTIRFRHIASPDAMGGEVSGHYHPKARIKTRARAISGRCFIHDGRRMIMPAFGAYTGGLSVLDPSIGRFFPGKAEILFCHACQIYRYPYSHASQLER